MTPLMRFARGDVKGSHLFTQNRPSTFVSTPRGFAAVGKPKNQLAEFLVLFDFRLLPMSAKRKPRRMQAGSGLSV
jgi:hypothetical protein